MSCREDNARLGGKLLVRAGPLDEARLEPDHFHSLVLFLALFNFVLDLKGGRNIIFNPKN